MTTAAARQVRDPRPKEPERPSPVDRLLEDASKTRAQGRHWKHQYRRRVLIVDSLVITAAVMLAQFVRFGSLSGSNPNGVAVSTYLTLFSAALIGLWLIALGLQQSRDLALAPQGAEEFRRVATATAWVFGVIAAVGLLFQLPMARGYLAIALPVGLIGLLLARALLRRTLAKSRSRGEYTSQVVVLGKPDSIISLCRSLSRSKFAGYSIVGACVPDFGHEVGSHLETPLGSVPVFGDERAVERALFLTKADTLAVAAVEHLGHEKVKQLAWLLDSLAIDMIVVPGMTDVAGPRLKVRPIDNLPLFHIARPRHDGPSRYGKRLFDLVFASMAVVALAPVMVAAAIAIKREDGGPVMFRQERVGQHGKRFRIFKFRTMTVDAEARQHAERVAAGQSDSVFFKPKTDSRITRIGGLLRRTSIDELPQLFNVLQGSMSIVGPRPLAVGEGLAIPSFIERRNLVKPGMTGLWQVSGRSNLPEEDRIRLDHSYIDNWSWINDLVIVWRTIRPVLLQEGAR
jgi:exopolysaccharide biosynthesis polyprenyl glycosylphosphotransferase